MNKKNEHTDKPWQWRNTVDNVLVSYHIIPVV